MVKYSSISLYPYSLYSALPSNGLGIKNFKGSGYQLILNRAYKVSENKFGIKKIEFLKVSSNNSMYRKAIDNSIHIRRTNLSYSRLTYCENINLFSIFGSCFGGGIGQFKGYLLRGKYKTSLGESVWLEREKLEFYNFVFTSNFEFIIKESKVPVISNIYADYSFNPFEENNPVIGAGISIGISF